MGRKATCLEGKKFLFSEGGGGERINIIFGPEYRPLNSVFFFFFHFDLSEYKATTEHISKLSNLIVNLRIFVKSPPKKNKIEAVFNSLLRGIQMNPAAGVDNSYAATEARHRRSSPPNGVQDKICIPILPPGHSTYRPANSDGLAP
jgi:hypothetical protein